jgi:carboxylesterase type B
VTRDLHRAVLAFVRGDPAQPEWPRYERVRRQTAVFCTPFSVVADPDGDRRRLWDAVHGRRGAGLR